MTASPHHGLSFHRRVSTKQLGPRTETRPLPSHLRGRGGPCVWVPPRGGVFVAQVSSVRCRRSDACGACARSGTPRRHSGAGTRLRGIVCAAALEDQDAVFSISSLSRVEISISSALALKLVRTRCRRTRSATDRTSSMSAQGLPAIAARPFAPRIKY